MKTVNFLTRVIWIIPLLGWPLLTHATLNNEATARLLVHGDKVVSRQFTIKQDISLPEVKVTLQLVMTLSPEKAHEVSKTLKNLQTASGHRFPIVSMDQSKTATGLVNITAHIVGHLPVADALSDISALTKKYTNSGERLTVIETIPYFPDMLRQKIENSLTISLFHQATDFLKMLNRHMAPTRYEIAAIDFTSPTRLMPRPVILARSQGNERATPLGMQKTLSMQANVIYLSKKAGVSSEKFQ